MESCVPNSETDFCNPPPPLFLSIFFVRISAVYPKTDEISWVLWMQNVSVASLIEGSRLVPLTTRAKNTQVFRVRCSLKRAFHGSSSMSSVYLKILLFSFFFSSASRKAISSCRTGDSEPRRGDQAVENHFQEDLTLVFFFFYLARLRLILGGWGHWGNFKSK